MIISKPWSELLNRLQSNGLEQVSLVVTDGLRGLEETISKVFPMAKQQRCLIHIARNLANKVKKADRSALLAQFKTVYQATDIQGVLDKLENLINDWSPKYKNTMEKLNQTRYLLNQSD